MKLTREKDFSQASIAELIEFSHMGTPVEQWNIGIELEQKMREVTASLVHKAFQKAEETYHMV